MKIVLLVSLLLLGCESPPNFNQEHTDELGKVLAKDLRFMKLPQTGRCYAYAWVSAHDRASAIVFEVPCEGGVIPYPYKPNPYKPNTAEVEQ